MITIKLVCVGTIKEDYYVKACQEYIKRLSKFAKLEIIEVPEYKLTDKLSDKNIEIAKEKETLNIIKHLQGFVVALDINGQTFNSEELAKKIDNIMLTNSVITFVIGGSFGFSKTLLNHTNLTLSFSKFTFPHQLMRVILLEQLYRSFTINNNITYHK